MKVSKEFILEAHKAACSEWKTRIEKEFPKLFTIKLEVGKWYNYGDEFIVFFTDLSDTHHAKCYGFYRGKWIEKDNFRAKGGTYDAQPATEEEVKQALIAEAKKRGFKDGVTINQINEWNVGENNWTIIENYEIFYVPNGLFFGNNCVFKNGKWAEIIPQAKELTVAEIEEKLGYKIKIVK